MYMNNYSKPLTASDNKKDLLIKITNKSIEDKADLNNLFERSDTYFDTPHYIIVGILYKIFTYILVYYNLLIFLI